MFNNQDKKQLELKGISLDKANEQMSNFVSGFPPLNIISHASINDGIISLTKTDIDRLIALYDSEGQNKKIEKFVPASGAATRMFKDLFSFLDSDKEPSKSVVQVLDNMEKFAFFDELQSYLKSIGEDFHNLYNKKEFKKIIKAILLPEGLNYGKLPKGLLSFHKYNGKLSRKALEEHLVEGILYAKGKNSEVNVHFTVSPEHKDLFKKQVQSFTKDLEKENKIKINVSYSEQKSSTDTIAADMENNPFRDVNSNLVFRPGGHGALIENLNELSADIIFIKNIDNVVPDHLKKATVEYKKALAGYLLQIQGQVFTALKSIDENTFSLVDIEGLLTEKLCFSVPESYHRLGEREKLSYLRSVLNRPIRVCGMVKNLGEPGGGPFWVIADDGAKSLQIVESAQIDLSDPQKASIFNSSTHFNPVDLICAIKDYKANKFDLPNYVDKKTGFISQKSLSGKDLQALELPGLWNGAMSNWTTIFVEVPIETFNPVKTINDLLRETHQGI